VALPGGEGTVPESTAIRYRAFMSYSHRDAAWARWLHKALESYGVDKDLVGRESPVGAVPKTLRPIFRDREDFSGGHTLTAATVAALDASAALLVLCSTVSATRPAVNEEVRLFRSRHPDRPVIPVILGGTPPDNFPPALRYELAVDGRITDRAVTILGPDLRDSGDGKSLGLAKVIAGLIGIGADEVFRRAERARKRRNQFWAAVAGVFLALALAASASAVYAWHQLKTNEAFLNATLKRATEIVDEAVAQAEKYNVPRTATLALLGKAEGMFADMAQYGTPTPELRYRKAWMLIQFARNYQILGDTAKQLAHAKEAHRLLAALSAQKPDDISYHFALSAAFNDVGDVLLAQGKLDEALKSYGDSLAIRKRLADSDSSNTLWQRELSVSYDRLGDILVRQGKLDEALRNYRDSLAIAEHLAASDRTNTDWQRDLSLSYDSIADVQMDQGDFAGALKSYSDSLEIKKRLAASDRSNIGWQSDLALSYERFGDGLMDHGELEDAARNYRDSLAIRERIATADRSNTGWQSDLSIPYEKVGDALLAQGKLDEALKSYGDSLAIRKRLADSDTSNKLWQRTLSVSYSKIGDVLARQKKLDEALKSYRDSVAIFERLAASDPSNKGWQRDLAFSYGKVGDVLALQSKHEDALKNYRDSLVIRERLAASDRSNIGWQRDLVATHTKLARQHAASGNLSQALISLRNGRDIIALLGLEQWLTRFDHEIATLEKQAQEMEKN
jgi:tetratricopeptide (TPR) repeat protein